MAVTYIAALRTTRMQAVQTAIDQDVGPATLEVGTAGFGSTLVIFTLSDPASSVAGDVLTLLSLPKTNTAAVGGVAAEARIKSNSGTIILSGLTVGTSGTNVIISPSTTITIGQTVNLTAFTITHPTT